MDGNGTFEILEINHFSYQQLSLLAYAMQNRNVKNSVFMLVEQEPRIACVDLIKKAIVGSFQFNAKQIPRLIWVLQWIGIDGDCLVEI